MIIKQLFKKWWFWFLLVIGIFFVLFTPLINCHSFRTSDSTTVKQCQSLFDYALNGSALGKLEY
ncbi:MAG: hypothetical protein V1712_00645 [Patescibacteria group bacterium]